MEVAVVAEEELSYILRALTVGRIRTAAKEASDLKQGNQCCHKLNIPQDPWVLIPRLGNVSYSEKEL